jgi:hypothetical protein
VTLGDMKSQNETLGDRQETHGDFGRHGQQEKKTTGDTSWDQCVKMSERQTLTGRKSSILEMVGNRIQSSQKIKNWQM